MWRYIMSNDSEIFDSSNNQTDRSTPQCQNDSFNLDSLMSDPRFRGGDSGENDIRGGGGYFTRNNRNYFEKRGTDE